MNPAMLGDTIEILDWNGKFCAKGIMVSIHSPNPIVGDLVLKATKKADYYNVPSLNGTKGYYDFDHRFRSVHTRVVLTEKKNKTFRLI